MERHKETYVYIIRCADNTYYTGVTNNLVRRVRLHNQGKASAYTRARVPVELVYSETCDSLKSAMARERQIKGWSRAKKEALIAGKTAELKELSRCRSIHKQ